MSPASERIERVRRDIESRMQSLHARCAFLTGSIIEGFGNANSDIDVIVIGGGTTAPTAIPDGRVFRVGDVVIELSHIGGERIDFETWPVERVEVIVRAVSASHPDDSSDLDPHALKLLHQMRVGIPVAGGPELERMRNAVSWANVAERLRAINEASYVGYAEDAAGAIKSADAATAMLTSRWALGCAVDCLTAAYGHTNGQAKWRYRKLADLGLDAVLERCLAAECDAGPDDFLAASRRRLLLAQELIAEAGTRSFQQ